MLSIIIPARNEKFLERTIKDILENAEGEIEVIAILDGYIPDPQIITNDKRVLFIHYEESIGQRAAINYGAKIAKGKYIMKCDAHCSFDNGFDVKLAADCEYDWTIIPRMYNLDIETWKPKLHKRTDYMYIGCGEGRELRAEYYGHNQPKNDKLIDDVMVSMGPCFFMHRERFLELGGCDEKHGGWGQQGVEMACKAWLSGGSLKVNKKTWFAHWFRGGGGPGFPYPISGNAVDRARDYSRDLWLNNKWPLQKRNFSWLIDKFNPPGWNINMEKEKVDELHKIFYRHIHVMKREPEWKSVRVIKMPSDLLIYHQVIWKNRPDFIIDSGTKFGGSALFFADMLELTGKGKVITIDKYPLKIVKDPRIIYLRGGSTSNEILAKVKEIVGGGSVMVVLDSDHRRPHVKRELYFYAPIVTKGQFMVVEDCYNRNAELIGPGEARDWFLKINKDFKQTDIDKQFLIGYTRDGWLLKIK